jgi:hypothetical protein
MRTTTSLVLLAAALFFGAQDPQPAPAPPQPVGKPPRHALEGVYELQKRVHEGATDPRQNRGYLVITNRHLFLSLVAPGVRADRPLVHSSVREWREAQEDVVRTTFKIDLWTDSGGDLHLEPAGKQELRRIEVVRGGVRVFQDDRSWLDFERIE